MKFMTKFVAISLAYILSVQPLLAAVPIVPKQAGIPTGIGFVKVLKASPWRVKNSVTNFGKNIFSKSRSFNLQAIIPISKISLVKPSVAAVAQSELADVSAQTEVLPQAQEQVPEQENPSALLENSDIALTERLNTAAEEVSEAGQGLQKASIEQARPVAEKQFSVLTGEQHAVVSGVRDVLLPGHFFPESSQSVPSPKTDAKAQSEKSYQERVPPVSFGARGVASPEQFFQELGQTLSGPRENSQIPSVESSKEKVPFTRVFKDAERNQSFWRYMFGYVTYTFGFQMYVVGLPYLISSMTKNSLRENHDPRLNAAETLKMLIRQNRANSRKAHWGGQIFGYLGARLFTRDAQMGPGKWLVRSFLIRSVALAFIPTLFFASGLLSLQATMWTLFILIAAHSFFQGISVTMESAGLTRIMGDKSVTKEERTKANAVMNFAYNALSIIGPIVAGQISCMKDFFGKKEVGGAVIYGVYALGIGLAGLIFSSIKIFKRKAASVIAAQAEGGPVVEKLTLGEVLKDLYKSIKNGAGIIFKSRFFRTSLILSLITYLFSDPLAFNVLPEYMENVLKASPALSALLGIPGIGWLLKGMTSTPIGFFGLLMVFQNIGGMVGSLLMQPISRLLHRWGFVSEESQTVPLSFLAVLEAPFFYLMITQPSMWVIMGMYGLQAFVTGFVTMVMTGINQKKLGEHQGQVIEILTAQSLMVIVAALISTCIYGSSLFTGIPIATSLVIAAVATTLSAVLRAVAPWFYFTKEERRGFDENGNPVVLTGLNLKLYQLETYMSEKLHPVVVYLKDMFSPVVKCLQGLFDPVLQDDQHALGQVLRISLLFIASGILMGNVHLALLALAVVAPMVFAWGTIRN